MKIVPCTQKYWMFIRELRFREGVKEQFITQKKVSMHEQRLYMLEHEHEYYIGLVNNTPVGFVGCVDDDIRIAVIPERQGKRHGLELLRFITKKYPEGVGKVKINNTKSEGLFMKAGFTKKYFIYEKE